MGDNITRSIYVFHIELLIVKEGIRDRLKQNERSITMEIEKLIFLDDTYLENCTLSHDIPKEIAEISSSFVKITTDKSTIQYVNLDYIQMIIPKKEKFKKVVSDETNYSEINQSKSEIELKIVKK